MSDAAASNHARAWDTPDEFGVPGNMFGGHAESFFARLARIVMVAALLEHRLLFFYQALNGVPQHEGASLPASTIVRRIKEGLKAFPALSDHTQVEKWLDECAGLLDRRNHHVHDLWPAQDGGRIFGWRFDRKATPDSLTKFVDLTADEMQADLERLLDAVRIWERVYSLVSGGRHLATSGGAA